MSVAQCEEEIDEEAIVLGVFGLSKIPDAYEFTRGTVRVRFVYLRMGCTIKIFVPLEYCNIEALVPDFQIPAALENLSDVAQIIQLDLDDHTISIGAYSRQLFPTSKIPSNTWLDHTLRAVLAPALVAGAPQVVQHQRIARPTLTQPLIDEIFAHAEDDVHQAYAYFVETQARHILGAHRSTFGAPAIEAAKEYGAQCVDRIIMRRALDLRSDDSPSD